MQRRNVYILLASAGVLITGVFAIALALPQSAKAQCGSQASSCKNCHEVQGQDAVNADGTGWHQSHAFGDFCYICHGGNNQATEKDAAHAGMVAPMDDIQAACAQCHPNDLQARAQVYADALHVQLAPAPAASPAASSSPTAAATPAAAPVGPSAPAAVAPAASDAKIVDYVQRYDQRVLGQQPTNWGNVVFGVILVGLLVAGGTLMARREGWLRISFRETAPLNKEYPPDVAKMADEIAKLKPATRTALQHLLHKGAAASDLLSAIEQLSPTEPDTKED